LSKLLCSVIIAAWYHLLTSSGGIPDLNETFAALKHYNYRLWFIGQTVSLMGTWMQSTAQGYLIYQLTKSTTYLGLIGFMGGVPILLFSLYGGWVADRISRRTLLVVTQASMMILALILAALDFAGIVQPWHILVMALLLGVANAFDAPARISFVLELVDRADMNNAIALNSTMYNIATVVGPSVAGLTYAAFGAGWCFTLNGISFIAVIAALLLMHIKTQAQPVRRSSAVQEIAEGVHYVISNPLVLSLTASVGMVNLFGFGFLNLLPAWATDVLHGDVTTNGLLISARGFGALVSALMLASLGRRKLRGKLWMIGTLITPVALFMFAWIGWLPLSLGMLAVIGWSMMLVTNNNNSLVQSEAPDELRGRVTGVYAMVMNGAYPIGTLLTGAIAQSYGAPATAIFCAVIMFIFAVTAWFFFPYIHQHG
jgi:predicted MFS family arabinose efflux permease